MSYFDQIDSILRYITDNTDRLEPPTLQAGGLVERSQAALTQMTESMLQGLHEHRLTQFAHQMEQFGEYMKNKNELEAIEARLAAMDAAEGVTHRMDRINRIKEACAEAEQQVWTSRDEFNTNYDRNYRPRR